MPKKSFIFIQLFLLLSFLMTSSGKAAEKSETWTASSTTAVSITGNVRFSETKLTFENGKALILQFEEEIPEFEDVLMGQKVKAKIYRVVPPRNPTLKNGNKLCGGKSAELVTYIAVWSDGSEKSMEGFSGKEPPTKTNDPHSCGIFNYDVTPSRNP